MRIVKAAKGISKRLLWRLYPRAVSRMSVGSRNEFSIAIMTGKSPFELTLSPLARNPVLTRKDVTEVPAGTVADPFMLEVNGTWYMFFELMNQFSHRGEIALATSQDALEWKFDRIVLSEPYHMSYPYVFEWQGGHYMIPETGRNSSVDLYRADHFPFGWRRVATLLEGLPFADSSPFRFNDRWWLFTDAGSSSRSPSLRLYFSDDLLGPWTEHPKSPLANGDHRISRPAGRVVVIDDTPVRFAQNVYPVYGSEVYAFEIRELSTTRYSEKQVGGSPVIGAGSEKWNRHGMHHIDLHCREDGSWLACVDGCIRRNFDESLLRATG